MDVTPVVDRIVCPHCGQICTGHPGFSMWPRCIDNGKLARPPINMFLLFWFTVIGLVSGVWAAFESLGMGGDGSGWLSPVKVCWIAVFASPAAAIAWSLRHRRIGVLMMLCLLFVLLTADWVLAYLTVKEGVGYALKLFRLDPIGMLAWTIAWYGWQVVVI